MEDRIKKLEEEICYLRQEIERLKQIEPEIHYHFTMITKSNPDLNDFLGGLYNQPTD